MRIKRSQAWIFLGMAIVLSGGAAALSLVSTPGAYGIPNYIYFDSNPGAILIEAMVIVSALWTGIAFTALFRWAPLLVLLAGMTAVLIGGALFIFTFFFDCVTVTTSIGAICVQLYPQPILLVIWGVAILFSLPVVWILQRKARRRDPPPA